MSTYHDRYAERLFTLYSETKQTRNRLNREQSRYDKTLSAFYHDLEQLDISPADSYEYIVALQNILLKRRAVKQELYHVDIIYRSLKESVEKLKPQRRRATQRTTEYNRTLNVNLTINDVL